MAYIGQRPVVGRYVKLDQISSGFNGSNTDFSMTAGSQAVFPGTARNLLLSLGGVIQEPDTNFTISGSTLTFTTPPVANTTFFGVIYGDMQATGTPSDGTVLPASIASSGHFKIPQLTVNEDGADVDFRVEGDTDANLLFVDASTDRVGIGTDAPAYKLELEGSGGGDGVSIGIQNTGSGPAGVNLLSGHGNWSIYNSKTVGDALELRDESANSTRMIIDSSGRVGIGTSAPGSLLSLVGATDAVTGISLGATTTISTSRYIGICQAANETNLATNSGFQGIEFGGPASANEGYLAFHTHDVGVSSGERVRITKGGQVGIGTDTPGSLLSISGANGTVTGISLGTASTAITTSRYIGLTDVNNNANLAVNSGFQGIEFGGPGSANEGYLAFHTHDAGVKSAERVRIDKSGNVGIGIAAPTGLLHIKNDSGTSEAILKIESESGQDAMLFIDTSDGSGANADVRFARDGSTKGRISFLNAGSDQGHMRFTSGSDGETMRLDASQSVLIGTTTSNNSARLQVTTPNQVVASFESTNNDPQIYLGDDMSSPTNNALIFGYDRADNRGYLTIAGDADTTLSISDGSLVGINTSANVEHFNVAGNIRLINPTGTTRRINALPSGSYTTGVSGGAAICFERVSDGGGGSDEIFFETHSQGVRHGESCRITKQGNLKFPSGQGIDFSATGDAGGMTSELLDDYEEGTWNPDPDDGNNVFTHGQEEGRYIKIGNIVHCTFRINVTLSGTSGFAMFMTGLPFTVKDFSEETNEGISTAKGTGQEAQLEAQQGQTKFKYRNPTSGAAMSVNDVGCVNNVVKSLRGAITYITT